MSATELLKNFLSYLKRVGWLPREEDALVSKQSQWLSFAPVSYTRSEQLLIRLGIKGDVLTVDASSLGSLSYDQAAAEIERFLAQRDPHRIFTNFALLMGGELSRFLHAFESRNISAVLLSREELEPILDSPVPLTQLEAFVRIVARRADPKNISDYSPSTHANHRLFRGRRHELSQLLRAGNRITAITGARKIGKSSLAYAYKRALVALHAPDTAEVIDCLTTESVEQLLSQLGRWKDSILLRRARENRDFASLFRHLGESNEPIHIILDEVDSVIKNDNAEFMRLLAAARSAQLAGPVRVTLVGWKTLNRFLLNQESNAAFGRILEIPVRNLHHEDARRLIKEPMTLYNVKFEREESAVTDIISATDGHPYLIISVCDLLIASVSLDSRVIKSDELERGWRALVRPILGALRVNTTSLEELLVHLAATQAPTFAANELRMAAEKQMRSRIDSKQWTESLENLEALDVFGRGAGTGSYHFKIPLLRDHLRSDDYDTAGQIDELAKDIRKNLSRSGDA